MEIIVIFADLFYTIKYSKSKKNEFARIFEFWRDPEQLFNFFEDNLRDLQSGFYGEITVEEAVLITIKEASELERRLLNSKHKRDEINNFLKKDLFTNPSVKELIPKKAYGYRKHSWLRLYAIELSNECFLITGGTIKLTHLMQERQHTKKELIKIQKCLDFLKENGIFDNSGIIDTIETQENNEQAKTE